MIFKNIAADILVNDEYFDLIYPDSHVEISEFHFTPVEVAIVASRFLVQKVGTRVLDIGSGAGKFCMIGSLSTNGFFVGVEIRQSLHELAIQISQKYKMKNVCFKNANITEIAFDNYDAFYIFNPFFENISPTGAINDEIPLNKGLYQKYNKYVSNQLKNVKKGSRLVTYFSYLEEIPNSFELISSSFDDKLKMWQKTN
jgi:SAM-dependent methyltransferase